MSKYFSKEATAGVTIQFFKDTNKKYLMIISDVNCTQVSLISETIRNEIEKYKKIVADITVVVNVSNAKIDGSMTMEINFVSSKRIFSRNIAGLISHSLNQPYFEDVVQ